MQVTGVALHKFFITKSDSFYKKITTKVIYRITIHDSQQLIAIPTEWVSTKFTVVYSNLMYQNMLFLDVLSITLQQFTPIKFSSKGSKVKTTELSPVNFFGDILKARSSNLMLSPVCVKILYSFDWNLYSQNTVFMHNKDCNLL